MKVKLKKSEAEKGGHRSNIFMSAEQEQWSDIQRMLAITRLKKM